MTSSGEPDVILLDVSEQDLPFANQKRTPEELLFNLTGVNAPIDNRSKLSKNSGSRKAASPPLKRPASAPKPETNLFINHASLDDSAAKPQSTRESLRKGEGHLEKGLDTYDLGFWTYIVLPDRKKKLEEESSSDADSEERERSAIKAALQNVKTTEEHPKDAQAKQREYWARVKETLGSIRMRTQMLQDISFADACKSESSVPVGANKDGDGINPAGVIVKQARRLAGLMHMEEQALSLRDLHQWLQTVGKGLSEGPKTQPRSALQSQLDRLRSLNAIKESPETLPTNASSELLQQVEHNLKDRLANLYQGKNFILSHQADFMANRDLESDASGESGVNEEIVSATMQRLQKMEAAYEILGSTILDSSKEVERMEEEFQMLQAELVSKGCPLLALHQIKKTKKSANKKPKKVAHSEDEGEQPLNQDDMDGRNDVKEDKKRNNSKAGSKKEKKKSPGQKTEKQKEVKDDVKKGGNSAENSGKSSTQSSSRVEKTDQLASSTMVSETSINKEEPAACGIKDPRVVSEDGKHLFLMSPNDIGGDSLDASRAQNRLSCMGNTVFPNRGGTCNVPNTMQYHMKSHRASSGRYVEKAAQTDDVVIISLKGGLEDVTSNQHQQMDIKDMLENMRKLQKQVQFWRTKNWAEKHREHSRFIQAPVYSSVSQFTKLHSSPEMGLVFYYNPETSICTMKSVSDLDSSLQQAILGLPKLNKENLATVPSNLG